MKLTKKSLELIIIIIVALAIVAAAVIFAPRVIRRVTSTQIDNSPNATVIECNVGQRLSESDLREVENIVRNIVGDKFVSTEINEGFAPMLNLEERGFDEEELRDMEEEEYTRIRSELVGDRLAVTSALLTEEEYLDIYTAIALYFDFDLINGADLHNPRYRNIFRAELN